MTAYVDEDLQQNRTFTSDTFEVFNTDGTPKDLTGGSANLDARYGDSETATLALNLTQSSGVTLGGTAGTFFYTVTDAQALGMTPGTINYDLIIKDSGGVQCGSLSGVWRLRASVA